MTRYVLFAAALLCGAGVAAAQPPAKTWRDADLAKPLPALHRLPDARTLEGLRANQFDAGFQGELQPPGAVYVPSAPAGPAVRPQRLPRPSYDDGGRLYASQPLYPFLRLRSERASAPLCRPQAGRRAGGR